MRSTIINILVNCELSSWGHWSLCSATCGGGSKESNRTINQAAKNGGSSCAGELERSMECNIEPCPGIMISNPHKYLVVFIESFLYGVFTFLIYANFNDHFREL